MKKKGRELSNLYISSFCLELSMLLSAGITPYEAALMLHEDAGCKMGKEGKEVKEVKESKEGKERKESKKEKEGRLAIEKLLGFLESGAPLSEAMKMAECFPGYTIAMTEVGERTGRLTETLTALSNYYKRMDKLSSDIRSAVLYPSVLLVTMSAVVLILIVQVLPVFNAVFSRIGAQMPPVAAGLMKLGQWLGGASAIIAAAAGVLIVAACIMWSIPRLKELMLERFRELLGDAGIFGRISAARFVYVMALASASGIDQADAAELAALTGIGPTAANRYRQCAEQLRAGNAISDSMLNLGIISVRNARLLSVGARGGKTDLALGEVAASLEHNMQEELKQFVGKIEPMLVIATSTVVGCILLSIMLPLISIMTAIG